MLRFGTYTRKSDDDRSVTEKSIGEQVSACVELAHRDSLTVVRTWEESQSARYPNGRPGYRELIKLIERGSIDGIICWHVNRLVRNMEEGGKLAQLLIEGSIKEIRTPGAIYKTGDNILPLVIEAASATQFSLDHSRTVQRGMEGNSRSGGFNGPAPQGYRNVRNSLNLKKGEVEIDPDRFEIMRKSWSLLLTETKSVTRIADTMNLVWGFRTRPTKKRGNQPLSYTGLFLIFTNPFYAGFVRYKGELIQGRHEPMITWDEFERAQAILGRRYFASPRRKEYAFTGLMHCVHCGQQITGEVKRLRDGRLWENYHCADSRLKCTKLGMSRDKVQQRLADELDSLKIDPKFLAIAHENIKRSLLRDASGAEDQLSKLKATLSNTESRLKRLDEMWLDGIVSDRDRYRDLEEREIAKKNDLIGEIARQKAETERIRLNLERSARFLKTVREEFESAKDWRIKELSRALASGYAFDGRKKTISVQVHPLLSAMVSYIREIGRLEPQKNGSHKRKEPTFRKSVLIGGRLSVMIEPPPALMEALKGELFPNLWEESRLGDQVYFRERVKRRKTQPHRRTTRRRVN